MAYHTSLKEQADKMRASGVSYSQITTKLGVPKSTLSTWFNCKYKEVYSSRQIEHLKKARLVAVKAIKEKAAKNNKEIYGRVLRDIIKYPLGNTGYMKTILASLYWAEGSKRGNVSGLKIVNTDPKLLNLYLTLLRKCYQIDESRIRLMLHLHDYHDKEECIEFWSKLLKVKKEQFWKSYIKERSKTKKFRENFRGICFVYYFDGNIRKELLIIAEELNIYYCR